MIEKFLTRIDTFLSLFERFVKVAEEDLERAKVRDELQQIFLARHAEAAENIASTSHAQTAVSKRTAEAIERSIPPQEGWDPK